MKNLLILCGGQSPEHSISLRSTKNILQAIDKSKYQITIIGISQEGTWRLVQEEDLTDEITTQGSTVSIRPGADRCFVIEDGKLDEFDVVFPVLHGPNGEDGTIQGLLRLLKLPFVGPDVLGSAISMDKDITKRLLRNRGIGVSDWLLIRRGDVIPAFKEIQDEFGEVVFVKPANMGSSVGVHRVASEEEWAHAMTDALSYDKKVLIEKSISGRELECAVLGNEKPKATKVGEVESGNFYSFNEKYDSSSQANIIIPAKVDDRFIPHLKDVAIKAYQALECEGMSRVDMFLTDTGEIYVNEVNTIPGFTSISMYPKLWEEEGVSYSDLIDQLVDLAISKGV